jgi:RHS repeat-associated protein
MGLKYTWGPGSDNLLAIEDSAGNHYYATTDRLGSIRTLARRDGTWLLTRRWDPYGNEISRDSSASFTWGSRLRYGWTGREYDVEIGMYYHRARYYSQSLRRFIQEDPVEGSTSPYAYVHGSPLEATDPSGMMDAYEMRMPDPREAGLLAGNGPGGTIDGVSYAGNNGWLNGIVASGGATEVRATTAADIVSSRQLLYQDYLSGYQYNLKNHDSTYDAMFVGASTLTAGEFTKAVQGFELTNVIAVGHSLLDHGYGSDILDALGNRLAGGMIFKNDSWLGTRPPPPAGQKRNASTWLYTVVDSKYAANSSTMCLASTLVHETIHAGYESIYGDPDQPPGNGVQAYMTGVGGSKGGC